MLRRRRRHAAVEGEGTTSSLQPPLVASRFNAAAVGAAYACGRAALHVAYVSICCALPLPTFGSPAGGSGERRKAPPEAKGIQTTHEPQRDASAASPPPPLARAGIPSACGGLPALQRMQLPERRSGGASRRRPCAAFVVVFRNRPLPAGLSRPTCSVFALLFHSSLARPATSCAGIPASP